MQPLTFLKMHLKMKAGLFPYVLLLAFNLCEGFKFLHGGNILPSGSLGFGINLNPLAPITGIINHAKKFIPGHQQTSKNGHQEDDQPHYQERPHRPRPEPYERPHRPPYEKPHRPNSDHYERPHRPQYERPHRPPYERPDYPHNQRPTKPHNDHHERPHHERPDRPPYEKPDRHPYEKPDRPPYEIPNKPKPIKPIDERPHRPDNHKHPKEPKEPKKEKPIVDKEDTKKDDLPSWEDIGEYPEGDIPIEEIIQPRKRPKRFIESKIYHVPVQFRSNAKPYKVQFKRETEKN